MADTFYLKMFKGDNLSGLQPEQRISDSYFRVLSGNVVAFFIDKNLDNEVEPNELVSISTGKNASVFLKGALDGDVVSNLDEHGTKSTLDDTLDMDPGTHVSGLVSTKQGLKGLTVGGGDVAGKILVGGNISNVAVTAGTVTQILAGSATDGATFDFFPGVAGWRWHRSVFHSRIRLLGSSISKIAVGGIGRSANPQPDDRIQAGDGGLGANGGADLTNSDSE